MSAVSNYSASHVSLFCLDITDFPALMEQLSPSDTQNIEYRLEHIMSVADMHYQGLREIFSDPEFMMVFQAHQRGQSGLVNEFIKQWITKHQNPTWAALVNLLEGLRVYSAARRIKTIIPTASHPASVHAAVSKKND